jgi:hypothetical protein
VIAHDPMGCGTGAVGCGTGVGVGWGQSMVIRPPTTPPGSPLRQGGEEGEDMAL